MGKWLAWMVTGIVLCFVMLLVFGAFGHNSLDTIYDE